VCARFSGPVLDAADSAACIADGLLLWICHTYNDCVRNCSSDTYLILSMSSMKKSMESMTSTRKSTTDPQLKRAFASQQYVGWRAADSRELADAASRLSALRLCWRPWLRLQTPILVEVSTCMPYGPALRGCQTVRICSRTSLSRPHLPSANAQHTLSRS